MEGCDEVIPRQAGLLLGGARHIRVAPGGVGHKSVPLAPVRDIPVEQGQQGAVRNRLPPYPQPVAAVQLPAQRHGKVCGEHQEQGPQNVAQSGQGIIVRRSPVIEMRHDEPAGPAFREEPPDGGRVVPPCVYLRGLQHAGGLEYKAGGGSARMSEDTSPLHPR